jgi:hypothetical protein
VPTFPHSPCTTGATTLLPCNIVQSNLTIDLGASASFDERRYAFRRSRHPGTFIPSIAEAHAIARWKNRHSLAKRSIGSAKELPQGPVSALRKLFLQERLCSCWSGRRQEPVALLAHAINPLSVLRLAQACGFRLDEMRHLLHGFRPAVPLSRRWRPS